MSDLIEIQFYANKISLSGSMHMYQDQKPTYMDHHCFLSENMYGHSMAMVEIIFSLDFFLIWCLGIKCY